MKTKEEDGKLVRRDLNVVKKSFNTYTYIGVEGFKKEAAYQLKSQKHLIPFMLQTTGKRSKEIAHILGVLPPSLSRTIERQSLRFEQFCKIYNHCTGEDFKTGVDFIDEMSGVYDALTLNQVVEILEKDEIPFVVQFGSYIFKLISNQKSK